jgi:hypothetical protein
MQMPVAERGSMSSDAASGLLETAGFTGNAYDLALHAVALKRAHDEARAS